MEAKRSLSNVQLALHMSENLLEGFLWLGLNTENIPREERSWSHVPRSDETVMLTFGRKGLKRVRAGELVRELMAAGFRFQGCVIARKRSISARGELEADGEGRPVWKSCLEVNLEHAPQRQTDSNLILLSLTLDNHVWRRGRAFRLPGANGQDAAVVELVQPTKTQPPYVTELHFERPGIFVKRLVHLP